MKKIIREILTLLWKVLRLFLWKWLKPILRRAALWGALLAGLVVLAVLIFGRC